MEFVKRCWAEIDLTKIVYNYKLFEKKLKDEKSEIIAVIKANAYGHGANEIAKELSKNGCRFFAVSNITEAINLRKNGVKEKILLLAYTPEVYAKQIFEYNLIQTVYSLEYAQKLNEQSQKNGVINQIYIKIDSGMGRIGFDAFNPENALNEIKQVALMKNLNIGGAFTHFAIADAHTAESIQYTAEQGERFSKLVGKIRQNGIKIPVEFSCNSAAGHYHPELIMNGIRLGISLYGLSPSNKDIDGLPLQQVMTLKTVVSMVKTLPVGRSVSYGRTYICKKETKVATVSMGYADGYPRILSNKGYMWVGGKRVPIIGRVCMDQIMLDVSGLDVNFGDEVTVFGGESDITIDEIANATDTINYEITCGISARVPRVFVKDGKTVSVRDNTY